MPSIKCNFSNCLFCLPIGFDSIGENVWFLKFVFFRVKFVGVVGFDVYFLGGTNWTVTVILMIATYFVKKRLINVNQWIDFLGASFSKWNYLLSRCPTISSLEYSIFLDLNTAFYSTWILHFSRLEYWEKSAPNYPPPNSNLIEPNRQQNEGWPFDFES